jgi:8-oxo-dGTP pyrophosphatase MutT (NUDIX family)
MLPKGWLDDIGPDIPGPMASGKIKAKEEALQKTAIREVLEEGGVNAKIIVKIGTSTFFYNHPTRGKIMKFVTFYLMEWISDSPKGFDFETSEIAWMPFKEALKTLSFDRERAVLTDAYELLPH